MTPHSVSFWPQIGFIYAHQSVSDSVTIDPAVGGATGGSTTSTSNVSALALNIYAPVLFHPVKHFHLGVGPYFEQDLISKVAVDGSSTDGPKVTSFGIRAEIGGWL